MHKDSKSREERQSEREIEEKDRKLAEEERKRLGIEKKDFDDAHRNRGGKALGPSSKKIEPKRLPPRRSTSHSDRTPLPLAQRA
jgi:hypothetical protein